MVRQIKCSVLVCQTGGILPSGEFQVGPYLTDLNNKTFDHRWVDFTVGHYCRIWSKSGSCRNQFEAEIS